jgi:hypothetical protein
VLKSIFFIFLITSPYFVWSESKIDQVFSKKTYPKPLREVSIIVTEDGYYPDKVFAYEGELVKFFITSTVEKPQCLVLQKHDVFLSAQKGKVNETTVAVDTSGRFRFYCPSANFDGHLTVFKKESPKESEVLPSRDIASEKPSYWLPRDYD